MYNLEDKIIKPLQKMKKAVRKVGKILVFPSLCSLLVLGNGCASGGSGWSGGGIPWIPFEGLSSGELGRSDGDPGSFDGGYYVPSSGWGGGRLIPGSQNGNIAGSGSFDGGDYLRHALTAGTESEEWDGVDGSAPIPGSTVVSGSWDDGSSGGSGWSGGGMGSPDFSGRGYDANDSDMSENINQVLLKEHLALLSLDILVARNYEESGQYDEAIEKLEAYPDSALANHILGNIYNKKSMKEEARNYWQKAVDIKSDFADAHHNLAVYYYEKGDHASALSEWRNVRLINPEYSNIDKNLELVEKKLGLSK